MAHQAHIHHISPTSLPAIKRVSVDHPRRWLIADCTDYIKVPCISQMDGSSNIMLYTEHKYQGALILLAGMIAMISSVSVAPIFPGLNWLLLSRCWHGQVGMPIRM